ncbi:MAG: helix-turn-helix transcriptional regulator [Bacillales bacterium]|nr:helix-turn-helix transcriptional regulator [Bacillales bacterium]
MNIEIANRLQKLRKEKGYTQEELADALGISRQAVSKWERAEASPDTDNLILLAKLYGVSLDDLLKVSEEAEDDIKSYNEDNKENTDNVENNKKGKDHVNINWDGIHVVSEDGDEVHIDKGGIHIKDGDSKSSHVIEKIETNPHRREIYKMIQKIVSPITVFGITIAYILIGSLLNAWHPAWIIFLLIPIIPSIITAFYKRKFTGFAFPVFVVNVYLILGLVSPRQWHPWWFVFLLIPVYYSIFGPIDHAIKKRHQNEVIFDLDYEPKRNKKIVIDAKED